MMRPKSRDIDLNNPNVLDMIRKEKKIIMENIRPSSTQKQSKATTDLKSHVAADHNIFEGLDNKQPFDH